MLIVVGMVALAAVSRGHAASVQSILPPPGLYQIDSDASYAHASGLVSTEQEIDGATGDMRSRTIVPGRSHELRSAGQGAATRCVEPRRVSARGLALAMDALARCPKQNHKVVGHNTLVHSAQCPAGNVTVKITRIDGTTWEYETRQESVATSGALDLSHMRMPLQHEARHGATPEARTRAARQLSELPALQNKLDKQRIGAAVELQAALDKARTPEERAMFQRAIAALGTRHGPGGNVIVVRERWTRIANQCTGRQPAR
jgi:hypothetical protein